MVQDNYFEMHQSTHKLSSVLSLRYRVLLALVWKAIMEPNTLLKQPHTHTPSKEC